MFISVVLVRRLWIYLKNRFLLSERMLIIRAQLLLRAIRIFFNTDLIRIATCGRETRLLPCLRLTALATRRSPLLFSFFVTRYWEKMGIFSTSIAQINLSVARGILGFIKERNSWQFRKMKRQQCFMLSGGTIRAIRILSL